MGDVGPAIASQQRQNAAHPPKLPPMPAPTAPSTQRHILGLQAVATTLLVTTLLGGRWFAVTPTASWVSARAYSVACKDVSLTSGSLVRLSKRRRQSNCGKRLQKQSTGISLCQQLWPPDSSHSELAPLPILTPPSNTSSSCILLTS